MSNSPNPQNPAHNLLNYIDDHKIEMKDDTYKGIVDRLAPINKQLQENQKTKYKVYFVVCSIEKGEDECMCEIITNTHVVEVYLSQADVENINERLDTSGYIDYFWPGDLDTQGMETVCTICQIFHKQHIHTTVRGNVDNEDIDVDLHYSNQVMITRIKKV